LKTTPPKPTGCPAATAPPYLSDAAKAQWHRLVTEYNIDDTGGRILLEQMLSAQDRMQRAAALISKHGEIVPGANGVLKTNPACAVERDARAQMLAALKQLNLGRADNKPRRPGEFVIPDDRS
jgi:P27 family predicted phage terminase small subunit